MNNSAYRAACEQGATFARQIQLKNDDGSPLNLTGYTASFTIRVSYTDGRTIAALTVGNGLTITPLTGLIDLYISATDTAGVENRTYRYELDIIHGVYVTRVLEGQFVVTPEVIP